MIERAPATDGLTVLPSDAADADPVMAQLATAATSGTLPAGPERRERPPLHLVPDAEPRSLEALRAGDSGLCRLAASVPAPKFHTIRYGDVLAPAATWREAVTPEPPPEQDADSQCEHGHGRPSRAGGSRYRPWPELLMRTFAIDLKCKGCGKQMKLKAFITSPKSLRRLCTRLGDPTSPPERAPARGPPHFATKVVRRALGEHFGQEEFFEGA